MARLGLSYRSMYLQCKANNLLNSCFQSKVRMFQLDKALELKTLLRNSDQVGIFHLHLILEEAS